MTYSVDTLDAALAALAVELGLVAQSDLEGPWEERASEIAESRRHDASHIYFAWFAGVDGHWFLLSTDPSDADPFGFRAMTRAKAIAALRLDRLTD